MASGRLSDTRWRFGLTEESRNSMIDPMKNLMAATPNGDELSGPSCCAVPVVAKHTAASTTRFRDRMGRTVVGMPVDLW